MKDSLSPSYAARAHGEDKAVKVRKSEDGQIFDSVQAPDGAAEVRDHGRPVANDQKQLTCARHQRLKT